MAVPIRLAVPLRERCARREQPADIDAEVTKSAVAGKAAVACGSERLARFGPHPAKRVVMWKTIFFAHDFSECARLVEPVVLGLAHIHHARIVLGHVSELPQGLTPETLVVPPGHHEPLKIGTYTQNAAEVRLATIATRMRSEGVDVETRTAIGAIPSGILAMASAASADVIAMGTHGREGLRHLLLGSVAEKVLRRAHVPVLTLRSSKKVDDEDSRLAEERDLEDELAG